MEKIVVEVENLGKDWCLFSWVRWLFGFRNIYIL